MRQSHLADLLQLVPAAFHRLSAASRKLNAADGLTPGMCGLLASIVHCGPSTASALAEMRPVSRQYVQKLVAVLLEKDWISSMPNPNDKRSALLSLTSKGRRRLADATRYEAGAMVGLGVDIAEADIKTACHVLETIIERISPQIIEDLGRAHVTN